jgi:hypothetical protein
MKTDYYLQDEQYLLYDELLDEGQEIRIGNLVYSPSQVLKAVDPIAYEIGFSEFVDFITED